MSSIFYENSYNKLCGFIREGRISFSKHGEERISEREIAISTIKEVLSRGDHEVDQDSWHDRKKRWTFVFNKKIDKDTIRVCAAAGKYSAVIVTAINLNNDITSLPSAAYKTLDSSDSSLKQEDLATSFDDLLQKKSSKKRSSTSSSKYGKKNDKPTTYMVRPSPY